ncbi:MAG TPA: hypothetical protein VL400_27285, partial [Polyangiaceae bacterium]|nr:hypothetical protein [Polyangiaceae bacterium]
DTLFREAERLRVIDPGDRHLKLLAYWAALHGATCLEKTRRLANGFPGAAEVGRVSARSLLSGWGASPKRLSAAIELMNRPRGRNQ